MPPRLPSLLQAPAAEEYRGPGNARWAQEATRTSSARAGSLPGRNRAADRGHAPCPGRTCVAASAPQPRDSGAAGPRPGAAWEWNVQDPGVERQGLGRARALCLQTDRPRLQSERSRPVPTCRPEAASANMAERPSGRGSSASSALKAQWATLQDSAGGNVSSFLAKEASGGAPGHCSLRPPPPVAGILVLSLTGTAMCRPREASLEGQAGTQPRTRAGLRPRTHKSVGTGPGASPEARGSGRGPGRPTATAARTTQVPGVDQLRNSRGREGPFRAPGHSAPRVRAPGLARAALRAEAGPTRSPPRRLRGPCPERRAPARRSSPSAQRRHGGHRACRSCAVTSAARLQGEPLGDGRDPQPAPPLPCGAWDRGRAYLDPAPA